MFKPIRKFWDRIQNDPAFMRSINGWSTIFWIVMTPISWALGWLSLVEYVSALSLWALVSGHLAAWQASRVEVEQARVEKVKAKEEEEHDEKLIQKIDEITPDA